jgi:hypothetical protein
VAHMTAVVRAQRLFHVRPLNRRGLTMRVHVPRAGQEDVDGL